MKQLLISLIAIVLAGTSYAQFKLDMSPSIGYMLNGKVQFIEGIIDIKDQPSLSISFSTNSGKSRDMELDYTWATGTEMTFTSQYPLLYQDFSTTVNIHYVSLNYISYLVDGYRVRPYYHFGAGVAVFDVDGSGSLGRLSFNFGVGAKYAISKKLGLKAQARLMTPIVMEGSSIYAGVGTGGSSAGVSLNATVPMVQFDFKAGLYYSL